MTPDLELWPDTVLPVPCVDPRGWRFDATLDALIWDPATRDELETVSQPFPEEFYLRELFALDLESPEALGVFVSQWGGCLLPEGLFMLFGEDLWKRELLEEGEAAGDELQRVVLARRRSLKLFPDLRDATTGPPVLYMVDADELRLTVSMLRDMTRVWQALNRARDWDSVCTEWESESWVIGEAPEEDAAREFSVRLTWCLKSLSPSVRIAAPGRSSNSPRVMRGFVSSVAAQLFNAVVESDIPYRACGNETCGRLFKRQQGRSKHGQNRTEGVLLYCSKACADAQAAREYRRRRRDGSSSKGGAK